MRIGIDIGGTKTRIAFIENGVINNLIIFDTNQDFNQTYTKIRFEIINWTNKKNIELISVGLPCPVKKNSNKIGFVNNLKSWEGVDIVETFNKDFSTKIMMNNDANFAALGQSIAKNKKNLVFITISTGIGCGIVIDGKIYEGFTGAAGEVANSITDILSENDDDKRSGIEFWASGNNIVKKLKELGIDVKNAKEAFERYNNNDPNVMPFFEKIESKLVTFFSTIIYIINPEIIVLGGSVAENNKSFFEKIFKRVWKVTKEIDYNTLFEFAENITENTLIGAVNYNKD